MTTDTTAARDQRAREMLAQAARFESDADGHWRARSVRFDANANVNVATAIRAMLAFADEAASQPVGRGDQAEGEIAEAAKRVCVVLWGRERPTWETPIWDQCIAIARAALPSSPAIQPAEGLTSGEGRAWPDIGIDPMKGERPDNRLAASIEAIRAAYVRQQAHVPDQTALVWRWHIGALLEAATRLNALQSRPTPATRQDEPEGAEVPIPDDGLVEAVLSALEAERNKPISGPEHGAWDRGRRYGLDDAIRIARRFLTSLPDLATSPRPAATDQAGEVV